MKRYRLHITCPAKHTTYTDYKAKNSAVINLAKMQDKTDWHATHIEITDINNKKPYRENIIQYNTPIKGAF